MRIKIIQGLIILFIAFLFFGLIYNIFYGYSAQRNRIKKNFILVQGAKILSIGKLPKSSKSCVVVYEFYYNKQNIKNRSVHNVNLKYEANYYYHSFPVVFESNDITNSNILVSQEGFDFFDLKFPDSLSMFK